jgi:hypothetical protein
VEPLRLSLPGFLLWLLGFCVGAAACYDPNFVAGVTRCSPYGACPNAWVCQAGVCVEHLTSGTGGHISATGGRGGSPSTGGTTGAGGSPSTGGTTGTGGNTVSCIQGGTYKPSNKLVTDFSDPMPDPSRTGQYLFGSRVGDPTATGTFASGAPGTLSASGAGLTYSATVEAPTASDEYPYNGFGLYLDGPGCADVSSYTGFSFTLTITGTCPVYFMFNDAEHETPSSDPPRGICAAGASMCYPSQFPVTSGAVKVPFTLTPTVPGMPTAAIDPYKLTGVQWQLYLPSTATTSCSGSITVQNLQLY